MTSALAIEATGLVKTFGDTAAVDGVDLAVPQRLGLRRPRAQRRRQDDDDPDARDAAAPRRRLGRVLGHDIVSEADAVRGLVSLTGQLASVDEDLTGRENLVLLGRLLGLGAPTRRRVPTSCSTPSGSRTPPGGSSRTTPAGCAGGSTSPPASSSRRS